MPLLVSLFDSSASQRSLDALLQIRTGNGTSVIVAEDTIDLDELAAKRTAGGGLLDSIANMRRWWVSSHTSFRPLSETRADLQVL
jgi:sodium-coupled neutral amino acid transporter 11